MLPPIDGDAAKSVSLHNTHLSIDIARGTLMKRYIGYVAMVSVLITGEVGAQDGSDTAPPPTDTTAPITEPEPVPPIQNNGDDTKAYTGANCQPRYLADSRTIEVDSMGLYNASTWKTIKVNCPIVRDSMPTTDESSVRSAEVRVNNPGDGSLQCTLISRGQFGIIPLRSMWKTDYVDFPADTVLDVTIGETLSNAVFSIDCTLPPRARIYGYQITEATITQVVTN